ncbi:MAG: hypothetical protein II721_05675, partial [Bacilli bacterium]|nr:hypothetical protein [Bacilli bacterium]
MYYSLIPILSLILVVIVNYGLFINRENDKKSHYLRSYKFYLLSLVLFFITDLLWGIFDFLGLSLAAYIDTAFYFAAMSLSVLAWTRFVTLYLHEKGAPGKIIVGLGIVFSLCGIVAIIINFFQPILFSYDANTFVP